MKIQVQKKNVVCQIYFIKLWDDGKREKVYYNKSTKYSGVKKG